MIKKILNFICPEDKDITRKEAQKVFYRNEETKEDIYNKFKRRVKETIKQKSIHSTCGIVEINEPVVLERKEDIIKHYKEELGYDVVIVDETILGKDWGEAYMLLSWKKPVE